MPIIAAVYLFCYFSKNHICSRLILSFSTKIFLNIQWGTGNITNSSNITLSLPISANILIANPFDISNTENVYPVAWDSTIRNAVRIICSNNTETNLVGYIAFCSS